MMNDGIRREDGDGGMRYDACMTYACGMILVWKLYDKRMVSVV